MQLIKYKTKVLALPWILSYNIKYVPLQSDYWGIHLESPVREC